MYANPSNRSRTDRQLFPDNIEFQNKPIPLYDFGDKSFEENKVALEKLYEGSTNGWLIINYQRLSEEDADMLDLYTQQLLDEAKSKWTDVKAEGIVVGRRAGRIISGYNIDSANEKRPVRKLLIPLIGGGYVLPFFQENAITLDAFNQILSTFEFTDQR